MRLGKIGDSINLNHFEYFFIPAYLSRLLGFKTASNFHTVYHQNGQQTINLQGNKAEAISNCRVILVGKQNEKEMKTTLYTIYKDSFVKENGKWLIKHRTSNFVHREIAAVQ